MAAVGHSTGDASPPVANVHVHRRPAVVDDAEPREADTAVLLHGITDAGHCWGTFAAELDPRLEVVMPDARGHGTTPLPDGPVTLEVLAEDVATVIEPAGPVVVVGHSMGAATAVALAAAHPDLVDALVLEDPPWGPAVLDDDLAGEPSFDFASWIRELQTLDHAGRVAAARRDAPHWSEAELQRWAVAKDQVDLRFFDRLVDGVLRRAWSLLLEVRVPMLLITGDVDRGAIVTPEVAAAAVQRSASLEVLHIAGASHSIHRDRLDACIDGVKDVLRRVLP